MRKVNDTSGIVYCGGGFKYFTNAYISIRFLRELGCVLPIELWMWQHEFIPQFRKWMDPYSVSIRTAEPKNSNYIIKHSLPRGSRWQWVLKPLAILESEFRHVAFLDADNFPLLDPAYLFGTKQYAETGAVFWPDLRRMEKERPIWNFMGVPYRDEPEFESGQMVIDTLRHREPLELALKMNQEAEIYYKMIWGDKDTFRFAFHKYGGHFRWCLGPCSY